jgi:hypothetical protein
MKGALGKSRLSRTAMRDLSSAGALAQREGDEQGPQTLPEKEQAKISALVEKLNNPDQPAQP